MTPFPTDRIMVGMTITMKNNRITSIAQLTSLIKVAEDLGAGQIIRGETTDAIYAWMNDLLLRLKYRKLGKKEKGIMRRYFKIYSGYTTTHIDHLISRYLKEGKIKRKRKKRTQPVFPTTYIREDIVLLAEVAESYSHQNGKALKKVCYDMYHLYHDPHFIRLKDISVSRLYDLKRTKTFKDLKRTKTFKKNILVQAKTRSVSLPIGERRKPYPEGKPGFLRVDSVHQGDKDKEKGVYHINLVDEVVQWELVVCVSGISEEFMEPALAEAIAQFPFEIKNFHSDNGSEYINKIVAKLLEGLRIKQTKSRARKTNDNGLVEGKNGSVIRKQMGHGHIPKRHAKRINAFFRDHLNPFVNYHRFSAFPEEIMDEKGKVKKKYDTYLTPCAKLLSIPHVEKYLKPGVTKESLRAEMTRQSHLEAAKNMQRAKQTLFNSFRT